MPYRLPNYDFFCLLFLLCLCVLCDNIVNKVLRAIVNNSFGVRRDIIVYIRDTNNKTALA